jgi:hypothetical protein
LQQEFQFFTTISLHPIEKFMYIMKPSYLYQ